MTPADLQGHWRRHWLKAPGVVDHDTCVHWMQCGQTYADIRIPAGRPDIRGATALADLSDRALDALAGAEGFAGAITVSDGVCTWKRRLNWHGRPKAIDAGRVEFDAAGDLLETGVHAEYSESWHRLDDTPDEALELTDGNGSLAVLVTVGTRFVLAYGPSVEAQAVRAGGIDYPALFSRIHVLGRWRGSRGFADLATNPLMEGTPVLSVSSRGLAFHSLDFHGRKSDRMLSPLPACGAAA